MKKIFLVIAMLGLAHELSAQSQSVTGNITTASSNCLPANCVLLTIPAQTTPMTGTVATQLAGTFSGLIIPEGSADILLQTGWTAISGFPIASGAGVTSLASTGIWQFNVAGLTGFRLRASAWTSGTATITIQPSNAATGSGGSSGGGGGGAITAASGAIASGALAAGALAVGSVSSGAFPVGSISDGADVAIGKTTDPKNTATDATSVTLIALTKELSALLQATLTANVNLRDGLGTNISPAVSGKLPVAIFDSTGANVTAVSDPCNGVIPSFTNIAITTATVVVAASAGLKTTPCGAMFATDTNGATMTIAFGTGGSTCPTSTTFLAGSSGGLSSGFPLAASAGFVWPVGHAYGQGAANMDLCIKTNGTQTINGVLWYVKAAGGPIMPPSIPIDLLMAALLALARKIHQRRRQLYRIAVSVAVGLCLSQSPIFAAVHQSTHEREMKVWLIERLSAPSMGIKSRSHSPMMSMTNIQGSTQGIAVPISSRKLRLSYPVRMSLSISKD